MPTTSDSTTTAVKHLATRRAERTQQRRLTRALGDDDRERVVDRERRHQQRDAGEHQQERVEEVEEVGGDVGVVLGGQRAAGDRLDAGGERRAATAATSCSGDTPAPPSG